MRSPKRFLAAGLIAAVALLGAACESGDTTVEDTNTADTGATTGATEDPLGGTGTETESPTE